MLNYDFFLNVTKHFQQISCVSVFVVPCPNVCAFFKEIFHKTWIITHINDHDWCLLKKVHSIYVCSIFNQKLCNIRIRCEKKSKKQKDLFLFCKKKKFKFLPCLMASWSGRFSIKSPRFTFAPFWMRSLATFKLPVSQLYLFFTFQFTWIILSEYENHQL